MTMTASQKLYDFIKKQEGCSLKAYPDVGQNSIGYGHRGAEILTGMVITQQQADDYLTQDVQKVEKIVNFCVLVPLTQGNFDALVSFTFNVGEGQLRKSTLLKLLNQKNYVAASYEFLKWDKSGGTVNPGLTNRRILEKAMYMS